MAIIRKKPPLTLPEIRPNAGIERGHAKALLNIVQEIRSDINKTLIDEFKKKARQEKMAMDGVSDWVAHVIDYLAYRWEKKLNVLAPDIAESFVGRVVTNYDTLMRTHLKKAGFIVQFQISQFQQDSLKAAIESNVGLIKSLASQYLERVQGDVWRCVTAGYDLSDLTNALADGYGITRRRAAIIARDQSSKAHATIELARRKELGITRAVWMHSHAGKVPRPSHVKANGKEFDISKGMYLDGEWVQPGQLPNCRCCSRSVIEGIE